MSPAANLLRLRNVSLHRAGLHDLSFDLAEARFLALLGLAGAGKSAVLALLAGLAAPDSGQMLLQAADLASVKPRDRRLGLVTAGTNLFAHLTVAQNIALPLQGLPQDQRKARVARLLDLLRLGGSADRYPAALTPLAGGRAALARALAGGPRLLLLDDPWDPVTRVALAADVARLRAALGFAVILATSDGSDARAWADTIAVLLDGHIAQAGPPRELYDRPVSLAVATCVGEVSRLHGQLRAIEDDVAVVALDCGVVVEAMLADAGPVGAACTIAIRPERVALAAATAADLGDGAVPAIIRDIRDRGDHVQVDVTVGNTAFAVRRPVASGLAVGRAVAIAWQPHHAWAFGKSSS